MNSCRDGERLNERIARSNFYKAGRVWGICCFCWFEARPTNATQQDQVILLRNVRHDGFEVESEVRGRISCGSLLVDSWRQWTA